MLNEENQDTMSHLCKVISKLAGRFNRNRDRKPWPELFIFILDCINSGSQILQWAALDIMDRAPAFVSESYSAYGDHDHDPNKLQLLAHRMHQLLANPHANEMIVYVLKGSPDYWDFFLDLVSLIARAIPGALEQDETIGSHILLKLVYGLDKVFSRHLLPLITNLLNVAKLETLDIENRSNAILLIVNLVTSDIEVATTDI